VCAAAGAATSYYNKCKEKIVILQSIGIIAEKSSKIRAVIYTCRYFSGNLIPDSVH